MFCHPILGLARSEFHLRRILTAAEPDRSEEALNIQGDEIVQAAGEVVVERKLLVMRVTRLTHLRTSLPLSGNTGFASFRKMTSDSAK